MYLDLAARLLLGGGVRPDVARDGSHLACSAWLQTPKVLQHLIAHIGFRLRMRSATCSKRQADSLTDCIWYDRRQCCYCATDFEKTLIHSLLLQPYEQQPKQ